MVYHEVVRRLRSGTAWIFHLSLSSLSSQREEGQKVTCSMFSAFLCTNSFIGRNLMANGKTPPSHSTTLHSSRQRKKADSYH